MPETHLRAPNTEDRADCNRRASGVVSDWPEEVTCRRCRDKGEAGRRLREADADREAVKIGEVEIRTSRLRGGFSPQAGDLMGVVLITGEYAVLDLNSGTEMHGEFNQAEARGVAHALEVAARLLAAHDRRREHVERYTEAERDDPPDCTHAGWRWQLAADVLEYKRLTSANWHVQRGCQECHTTELPEGFEVSDG